MKTPVMTPPAQANHLRHQTYNSPMNQLMESMKVLFIRAPILFINFSYSKTFFEMFPTVWLWDIFPFSPIIYPCCNMFHLSFNVTFSLHFYYTISKVLQYIKIRAKNVFMYVKVITEKCILFLEEFTAVER